MKRYIVPLAVLLLTLTAALLTSAPVGAQMILTDQRRDISVSATCAGVEDGQYIRYGPFDGSFWNDQLHAESDQPSGNATADAGQVSMFFPAGIQASGWCGGQWQGSSGEYLAWSHAEFTFQVDSTISYTFFTEYDAGDSGPPHTEGYIRLRAGDPGLGYLQAPIGQNTQSGRLPPGTYDLIGHTSAITSLPSAQGPTFAFQWEVQRVVPIIVGHPGNTSIACGGTLQLSVVANGSGLTYQWRRNLVPLTNGGNVSGATTASLTITNFCHAQAGYYDVVVTSGTGPGAIVEPSSLAHVTVTTSTAVLPDAPALSGVLTLSQAFPSPMVTSTSFRFAAREPIQASAEIYDARGRLVRTLGARTLQGTGTIDWDGRETSSVQAPAGVYFLRMDVGGMAHTRRFVRMR